MVMNMSQNGAFNKKESAAFEPGGKLSTPKERKTDNASDFLMPAERKYPYKVGGQISCNLLKAAMSRAMQNNEMAVHKKAKQLFMDHCEA